MSYAPTHNGIPISGNDRRALRGMLAELTSHKLEVILAPSKKSEIAERGGMTRVLLDRNAEWYRRMCLDHPSSRKRAKRAPDTRIKRQDTIQALEDMIRTGYAVAPYEHMIMRYVDGFKKDQAAQRDAERKLAYQRKLEKRKEARRSKALEFDPSMF